ncbi:hypothetical protein [Streptomyces chromofuscus]|uniref:Uncharacterized protein n=1 Tax=Streptomyces chromofuscus TaxID=42881 RepID=A0A7M2T9L8_STRCW|nr:hypothetical protein [Streptomyces chromofuscus]QOV44829.1 hypothetical protein IPT68_02080 [Streptomyces chromofuscus]GGS99893.1 hypothetical protein GCM10010254_19890 [Streptomyces chromofuscus]
MFGLAFAAPWLVLASTLWAMLPLVCPGRRRAGVVIALTHVVVTLAITRPWTEGWYWRDGAWLMLVFGQGALVALGRLAFELSPLGARRRATPRGSSAAGLKSPV